MFLLLFCIRFVYWSHFPCRRFVKGRKIICINFMRNIVSLVCGTLYEQYEDEKTLRKR